MGDLIQLRISQKVAISEATGCWEWTAAKGKDGYGMFCVGGKTRGAHRISYEAHRGPIPQGGIVCHKCDNRLCVNPDHLFLGTQADNVADRNAKGRQARGTKQGSAKLTEADVLAIRATPELSQRALARQYGVSQGQIYNVRSGKHWGHVGDRSNHSTA